MVAVVQPAVITEIYKEQRRRWTILFTRPSKEEDSTVGGK